jgi:hypothetical protein
MKRISFIAALACTPFAFNTVAQQPPSAPQAPAAKPDSSIRDDHDHMKMNERGEAGMGFSQTATTHHFLLKPHGGVIQAEAKDPADASNRDHIRMHLNHIAHAFTSGDFNIPMFVHDTVPPGVPEMQRLQNKIRYTYKPTANGGRIVISTQDSAALAAIHNFLRFQIEQHRTGDPTSPN